ncbi:MAG: 30S ribosomal protein S15 [Candidatus Saccharibacteria bacterium]|nr:30S ribosomal protein S15 [Candidatus Saccharibacteria bacterium]MCY4089012.1 30S ribosomal protein S15 [Candidatus Saccharibacteria bacterium]
MVVLHQKKDLIAKFRRSPTDVGSPEVQVAILTARIEVINQHLQSAKKDKMAQRGLLQLVGKRRRLLDYLADKDTQRYQTLIKQLKLRK